VHELNMEGNASVDSKMGQKSGGKEQVSFDTNMSTEDEGLIVVRWSKGIPS
jgi:hypothetical protein